MLILISDPFDDSLGAKLKEFGQVTTDKSRLGDASVVLVRSKTVCDKKYIDSAKNIKVIIRGGVGVDNIDVEYAKERGILVFNTPKASAIAVAELAFALMISVPNHLVELHNGMKEGKWLKSVKRNELYGKRLALLGLGNIGTKLAVRAQAFGMEVVAYDKYVTESDVAKLYPTAQEAVQDADYIQIHLPLTEETECMFCDKLIDACRRSPVVINTGRGGCIDADGMLKALNEGKISWYATDVYPSDPPAADYPLLKSDRVTLTPHVGGNTEENLLRIGDEIYFILKDLNNRGEL
ncbi:MAG: NAD(P)-dependent oxidoreductase [Sphaerochaetaceae bacterium]